MLFLGTAKYPDEDDYTTFLAQNGDAFQLARHRPGERKDDLTGGT